MDGAESGIGGSTQLQYFVHPSPGHLNGNPTFTGVLGELVVNVGAFCMGAAKNPVA
jgi:hypothetical protein